MAWKCEPFSLDQFRDKPTPPLYRGIGFGPPPFLSETLSRILMSFLEPSDYPRKKGGRVERKNAMTVSILDTVPLPPFSKGFRKMYINNIRYYNSNNGQAVYDPSGQMKFYSKMNLFQVKTIFLFGQVKIQPLDVCDRRTRITVGEDSEDQGLVKNKKKYFLVLNSVTKKNYSKILISSRVIKSFVFRISRLFQNDI